MTFRPSGNAHLCPMETVLKSHPTTCKVKPAPYQTKARLSYWRVACWLTAAVFCAIPWRNPRKQTLLREDEFQKKPVQLLLQELKWENTFCFVSVRNDWLLDARPHLHCNEKTARITLTSSILISHGRIDLKYKMALHNCLRKAKFEKCFWNYLLLHQQSNITPDIIDVVALLVKK